MAKRSDRPRSFLTTAERESVLAAIRAAERRTSGEIRLHMERDLSAKPPVAGDPYARARALFAGMGMHATEARNGVLFYLATRTRRFAVLGDEALHTQVGEAFWQEVAAQMAGHFAEDRFGDGLAAGIARVGERLAEHFPHRADDVNELADDISFGK
jgi:uncharacterized membrane protein